MIQADAPKEHSCNASTKSKDFWGSVFIEVGSKEDAEKARPGRASACLLVVLRCYFSAPLPHREHRIAEEQHTCGWTAHRHPLTAVTVQMKEKCNLQCVSCVFAADGYAHRAHGGGGGVGSQKTYLKANTRCLSLTLAAQVMGTRIEHAGAVVKMEPKTAYLARKRDERHSKPGSPHNPANAAAQPGTAGLLRVQV